MSSEKSRRLTANIVIMTFLATVAIDAMPSTCTAHQRLKDKIDPALDATGLWQESWRLFAPEPDSVNIRLSARVVFENGSDIVWHSPNYSQLNAWERFLMFRRMEYFDSLRQDNNSAAWEPFAKYIAASVADQTKQGRPVRVELNRYWVVIPEPNADGPLMPVRGEWKDPGSCQFYVWEATS